MPNKSSLKQLDADNRDLRARLEKAEATLGEILSGEADALFVTGAGGAQLFTLKGADQSYRNLIENMSEGALTLTPEGLVLYANRRFAEMLRAPLERVIGSELSNWIAPEHRQFLKTLLRKDAVDKQREELALVAADGTLVPVYLSVSRLVLNETDSVCMVVTDLTDQKRNEAILAAEKLSNAILEQAADAIVICDETGRIMRASKQAQALYGTNPIGQLFEQAYPLHQSDGTAFSAVSAIDTNHNLSVEARLECKGQGFDLLVSVGHLKDAQGGLLGSVVTLTDITDRKQAEKDLRWRTAFFEALVKTSAEGILVVDTKGRKTLQNQRTIELWNIPEEVAADPDDSRQVKYVTNQIVDVKQFVDKILYLYDHPEETSQDEVALKNGTILDRYSAPVLDGDGHSYGRIWSFHDVTERKKTEARVIYLNRVYAVLSSINSLIVRVNDREELFGEACNIAVEKGGFRMAMLAIVDAGTKQTVSLASAGMDDELLSATKGILSTRAGEQGSIVVQSIREKKAVVSNDVINDARIIFGKKYEEAGVRSLMVLPLIVAGEAVGVIALYACEIEFFQRDEIELLTELAGDIAFAIDHIDKHERLDYLAYYDVLTGLANRTLFLERLAQYIRSAASGGHKLALGLIDLERFKSINDSLSRPSGDSLLKQVAEWLLFKTRDANLLARIDADHFAIVLPEVRSDGNLAKLIDNLMVDFLDHPFSLNGAVFRIGFKVGIALFPDDGDAADILFKNAEAALKKAKASGNRFLFYTQKMTAAVAGKLALENQLRRAIDNEEFVLHYQPKVNLGSGKVTSAEALIRWNNPNTGLVPPGEFIPILEETGLIYEVGRWALRKVIEDNLRWHAAGLPAVRIAVNVSPLQLRNINFLGEIEQAIAIGAHAAAGLELEITESVFMDDQEHTIASLNAIRAMGITIAIDDFGTGFSSLSYLAKLPVDTLKIDRAFVIEMTASAEGLALVSSIVHLAHSLNLKVVAEGVETKEQSHLLRLLQCDEMQGFLFSKPVPCEVFETKFLIPLPGGKVQR